MVEEYNEGKIKVLLVSGAGSQGLDLKGTKLVQLLEPHWNEARLSQATGRAARFQSHAHLPEEDRHVHVQRYMSSLPKTLLQKAFNRQQKDMSADQYLDMLSKEKEALNEQFNDVLRGAGSMKKEAEDQKPEGERVTDYYLNKKEKDVLPGGLADHIQAKYFNTRALRKGVGVEKEHTNNGVIQKEIAKDHLAEDPKYYDKLEVMEKKAFWKGFASRI